jgi:glucose-specific phosphotransferase system IIA component
MNWMGGLQQFGRALMLPMISLPAVAVLLCLAAIPWQQWGMADVSLFFADAATAILQHLPYIFAIGVALGLTESAGMAGLAALVGYFIFEHLVVDTLELGVAGGILFGMLAAFCYHLCKHLKFPESVQFFGGPRFAPFMMALASLVLSLVLIWVGPFLQSALESTGRLLIELGGFGSFLYGTVHRLLVPLGLHHILNNFTWFQVGSFEQPDGQILYGDMPRFFAGDPEAGLYMAGMYPLMMFAVPAIALAMIHEARKEARAHISKIFITAALASLLTGVTEPIEFAFVFIAPWLFVIHALLAGSMMWVTAALDIQHGFAFSAGAIDFVINFHLSHNGWLILPIGAAYGVLYYLLFRFAIRRFKLRTPGRGEILLPQDGGEQVVDHAPLILHSLGGKDNIVRIEACITRLRLTLKQERLLDADGLTRLGAMGVIRLGGGNVQIVFGTYAELIRDQMMEWMKHDSQMASFVAPADGQLMPIADVPDEVFSKKILGEGFAVMPEQGMLVAPIGGVIKKIFPTAHALTMTTDDGLNLLLHIGIDTVKMNGHGFQSLVAEQQAVRSGQALIRFDLEAVRQQAASACVVMTIINSNRIAAQTISPYREVKAGKQIVLTLQLHDEADGGDRDV